MSGLTLQADEWSVSIRPECGGSLASLVRGEVDVLRPMPAQSASPLESACFPLVPYCNRIADGRFRWKGDEIALPRNFSPEVHSLHGIGWQNKWRVASADSWRCTLIHDYAGLGTRPWKRPIRQWPWAYRAEQRIRLGERGVKITLDITNLSNVPMPAGLGLHPYFRRRAETRVHFSANGMVRTEKGIPVGDFVPADTFADWPQGTSLPDTLIDHCFVDWSGEVRITDNLGTITMRAHGAPYLHCFAPPCAPDLCFEPVTHIPDALNQDPAGMISLPPGCTASMQMEITAS